MYCRFRELEEGKGPFPGEDEDAEDEVDDLEVGEGFDGAVEISGEKVPEDFWPEETFERGSDLINCCRQDDEARPMVLDELSHCFGFGAVRDGDDR